MDKKTDKAPKKAESKTAKKAVYEIAITGFLFKGRMFKPCKEHNEEINKPAYAKIVLQWLEEGKIKEV